MNDIERRSLLRQGLICGLQCIVIAFAIHSGRALLAAAEPQLGAFRPSIDFVSFQGSTEQTATGTVVDLGDGAYASSFLAGLAEVGLQYGDGRVAIDTRVATQLGDLNPDDVTRTAATTRLRLDLAEPAFVDVFVDALSLFGAPRFEFAYPGDRAHYAYFGGDGWTECNFPVEIPPEEKPFISETECTSFAAATYMVDWDQRVLLDAGEHLFELTTESGYHGRYGIPVEGKSIASVTLVGSEDICDPNADGECNVADIDYLATQFQQGVADELADINRDGRVDAKDHLQLIEIGLHSTVGDTNLDGHFDSTDIIEAFKQVKYDTDRFAGWADGDWNGDQRFDSADLVYALENSVYLRASRVAQAVPEAMGTSWVPVICLVFRRVGEGR